MVEVCSLILFLYMRITYIDRLKGLAMILVVMGHLILVSFKNPVGNPLFAVCETTEMMLFSFLSGFVVKKMSFEKVIKKLPQLLLPMLTIGILYTYYSGRQWRDFVNSPFKCGYWYFLFLAYCYFCLSTIEKCNIAFKKVWQRVLQDVAWLVFFSLLVVLIRHLLHISWNTDWLSLSVFYSFWPYFMLGYLFRKYNLVNYLEDCNLIFSFTLLLYIPFVILYCKQGHVFMHLAALCAIIVLLFVFQKREKDSSYAESFLGYIGKSSIDVYLFHFFLLNAINLSMVGKWFDLTNNYFVEFLVVLSIAILVSSLCVFIARVFHKSNMLNVVVYGHF